MTLTLRYTAISDKGLIRSGNQDSVYAGPRLIAVADGMGGMAAGDLASKIVIEVLSRLDTSQQEEEDLTASLADSVEAANAQLRETVDENPQMEGMGTTLTAFLFAGDRLGMVHIGDSRAYRLRNGQLTQVTKDDTYVQMLVDEGQLSAEEAETHPQRSLLLRALGSHEVEPTFATLEAMAGDRYLLCSDGLSGVVSDDTIEEKLLQVSDLQEVTDQLLQLALRGGGPDNVTVLVADVTDDGVMQTTPIVAGAAASDAKESSADPSTAAARAAAAATGSNSSAAGVADPEQAGYEDDPDLDPAARPRKRGRWYALAALLLTGVLVAGGFLVYQNQFYVGVDKSGQVAAFQGFNTELFGIPLSSVKYDSQVPVDDLAPRAKERVEQGIQAADQDEAQRILKEVTTKDSNLLEPCPDSDSSESPDPSDTPSETPSETPSGSEDPSQEGSEESTSPSTPPTSDSPTPQPGVDCRPSD